MIKKLHIYLICNILQVNKFLTLNHRMHNLCAISVKFHEICNLFGNFLNASGNIPRCGAVSKFSDLEAAVLSMAAETESIDSENLLFRTLRIYKATSLSNFPSSIH